jgi:DNA-binding GntR family transcriptional regulator
MARQLETVSTVEALERELERQILDGVFAPGEHLREVELSESYQVGRHTLRAAFDRLVRRGVLDKARNRGVFVREFTPQDVTEIYEVRTALEVQAFRMLAARRTVPPAAREATERCRALQAGSPRRLIGAADFAFHRAIVVGAGNERLTRAHQELEAEIELCLAQLARDYATPDELASQHDVLLAAIESGEPATAEAAIREHLERAGGWLLDHQTAGAPVSTDGQTPAR